MEKYGFYAVGYWPVDDEKEASKFPAEFARPRGSRRLIPKGVAHYRGVCR